MRAASDGKRLVGDEGTGQAEHEEHGLLLREATILGASGLVVKSLPRSVRRRISGMGRTVTRRSAAPALGANVGKVSTRAPGRRVQRGTPEGESASGAADGATHCAIDSRLTRTASESTSATSNRPSVPPASPRARRRRIRTLHGVSVRRVPLASVETSSPFGNPALRGTGYGSG